MDACERRCRRDRYFDARWHLSGLGLGFGGSRSSTSQRARHPPIGAGGGAGLVLAGVHGQFAAIVFVLLSRGGTAGLQHVKGGANCPEKKRCQQPRRPRGGVSATGNVNNMTCATGLFIRRM